MRQGYRIVLLVWGVGLLLMAGCHSKTKETQIQVFAASSLHRAMTELITIYEEDHPKEKVVLHTDGSGTLAIQIQEGFACDLFLSADQTAMDQVQKAGLIREGTRRNLLGNQLVVITGIEQETKVTGLKNLKDAESIALAGETVPAGRYTRTALRNLGIDLENASISEQSNVSKVLLAVAEGACEVGTVYASDTYGYEEKVKILEWVDTQWTGEVNYPVCGVVNPEAGELKEHAADAFYQFLQSYDAKKIFEKYGFETEPE